MVHRGVEETPTHTFDRPAAVFALALEQEGNARLDGRLSLGAGLFGFEQRQRCTVRKLKSAYRRLQATYHPDKFEPRSMRHCAEHASVILSAGRELLLVHGACGRRGRRENRRSMSE